MSTAATESPLLYGRVPVQRLLLQARIWAIDASKAKAGAELKPQAAAAQARAPRSCPSGEDDEGELYVVSIGGGVYHLVGRRRSADTRRRDRPDPATMTSIVERYDRDAEDYERYWAPVLDRARA